MPVKKKSGEKRVYQLKVTLRESDRPSGDESRSPVTLLSSISTGFFRPQWAGTGDISTSLTFSATLMVMQRTMQREVLDEKCHPGTVDHR